MVSTERWRACRQIPRPLLSALHFVCVSLVAIGCAGGDGRGNEQELSRDGLSPEVVEALDVVASLQSAMTEIMKAGPELGYQGRFDAIASVAQQTFDIPLMARASYGTGFDALTPEQQRTWIEIYERFHVSSLADVRDRFRGQVYRIIGYQEPGPGVLIVESKLDYPERAVDLYTDYRLRRTDDRWRIVDVHSPPSVSEVAMRRAEYRTVLDRHGFDGLIQEMKARIERRERP